MTEQTVTLDTDDWSNVLHVLGQNQEANHPADAIYWTVEDTEAIESLREELAEQLDLE